MWRNSLTDSIMLSTGLQPEKNLRTHMRCNASNAGDLSGSRGLSQGLRLVGMRSEEPLTGWIASFTFMSGEGH